MDTNRAGFRYRTLPISINMEDQDKKQHAYPHKENYEKPAHKLHYAENRFDIGNSTFKHRIVMKEDFQLVGYSKWLLTNETKDKEYLLQRSIIRLGVQNQYLFKAIEIQWYLNDFSKVNDDENLLLVLNKNTYELGPKIHEQKLFPLQNIILFLDQFYDNLKNNKPDQACNVVKRRNTGQRDPYDLTYKRFMSREKLQAYCEDYIAKRPQEIERMRTFYSQYVQKHLSDNKK